MRTCKECNEEYYFTGGTVFCKPMCKIIWSKIRDMKRRDERNNHPNIGLPFGLSFSASGVSSDFLTTSAITSNAALI